MDELKYKRVLLKVSGEALGGEAGRGLDFDVIERVCDVVARCASEGVQVGIVVGGGNFWRGLKDGRGMSNRTRADHMGMLATAINCLALADVLENKGVDVRVQTAIEMKSIAEPYIRSRAVRHLRRAGLSSSAAAPAAHSSPPIRRRYSGRRRSTRISFCLPRMWMGYTVPTP